MNISNSKRGFTLLEILLVVGIIAILAGIVIVAINPSKQLATVRNTQRKSDIKQIDSAVQQYYIDHNRYPSSITTSLTEICDTGSVASTTQAVDTTPCGSLVNLSPLVPTYLVAIPKDPQGALPAVSLLDKILPTAFAAIGGNGYEVMKSSSNKIITVAAKAELNQVVAIGTSTVATVSANTCTSFSYSDWSSCVDGSQSKTIMSQSPDGCTGGSHDVLTQSCSSGSTFSATGGDITHSGGYTIHTFTTSGTFTVTSGSADVEVLVVAGGGGGGSTDQAGYFNLNGGGGGGGGAVHESSHSVTAKSYSVVVGGGGLGNTGHVNSEGNKGGDSSFDDLLAYGGGYGGTYATRESTPYTDGGCGGGGAYKGTGGVGSQGYNGGDGYGDNANWTSGGGGGMGGAGGAPSSTKSGDGGDGIAYSIIGSSVRYGAGGGGGAFSGDTPGSGGNGGGGVGGVAGIGGDATGVGAGGGGAGWSNGNYNRGGNGSDGIVIIRYATN